MGFFSFIKKAAKKIGEGASHAAKWLGGTAKPFVHGVASAVEKIAPYVAGAAGAVGQTGLANLASKVGRVASTVKSYTGGGGPPAGGGQPPPGGGKLKSQ